MNEPKNPRVFTTEQIKLVTWLSLLEVPELAKHGREMLFCEQNRLEKLRDCYNSLLQDSTLSQYHDSFRHCQVKVVNRLSLVNIHIYKGGKI